LHLIGGATTEGGSIHRWARDTFRLPDDATIESALRDRVADAHGLTFLPLLAGERSPGWASNATGAINGLRPSTTPLDILQAALESVALRLSLIAQQMRGVTSDTPTFVASGGALLASPAWTQMMADALAAPIHMTAEPEITARGVGLMALRAAGNSQLTDYPPTIARTFEPSPDNVERLAAARERQLDFYKRLYVPS
jgi:gluconokinase